MKKIILCTVIAFFTNIQTMEEKDIQYVEGLLTETGGILELIDQQEDSPKEWASLTVSVGKLEDCLKHNVIKVKAAEINIKEAVKTIHIILQDRNEAIEKLNQGEDYD